MAKKLTTEEFIFKAGNQHNNFYTYEKVVYTTTNIKVIITCPIHGDFEQVPHNHLKGSGCKECASIKIAKTSTKYTTDSYKIRAIKIHGNKYDYTKTIYTGNTDKLTFTCPVHGDFEQLAYSHIAGSGCIKCGSDKGAIKLISKHAELFTPKANSIHNNKYNYDLTNYVAGKEKVIIICPIHGTFNQTPVNHLVGNGCPKCGIFTARRTYLNEATILYYIFFPALNVYKIGITLVRRGVRVRMHSESHKYVVLSETHFLDGQDAYEAEQRILTDYKKYRYTGANLLKDGNTELFTSDIRISISS